MRSQSNLYQYNGKFTEEIIKAIYDFNKKCDSASADTLRVSPDLRNEILEIARYNHATYGAMVAGAQMVMEPLFPEHTFRIEGRCLHRDPGYHEA